MLPADQRALADEDYMFSNSTVFMSENTTTASVLVTVLPVSNQTECKNIDCYDHCCLLIG